MNCHKCRCKAVAEGADGNAYCAYCQQFAPKPVVDLKEEDDD